MAFINDPVTFVVPGDLHLTEFGLPNHRAALQVVEELNTLIRPDFVQFIGDNVQDATESQFRLFDDLRQRLESPHYALVGDHDVHGDPGATRFRDRFGTTFGATSLRGYRFLRLDTQQARPVGFWDAQINWLASELHSVIETVDRPVIFQHNYPYQIWENFDGPGVDAWRSLVQTRRIEAILCGHTHYWQVANDGRNVTLAVRSIGDPEGGPPGYLVGHLQGDDFAAVYRTVEDHGPLVMITHPRERILTNQPRQIVTGPDRIETRVWSRTEITRVSAQVDDGLFVSLERLSSENWAGPLDGERLAKGSHRLVVEAIDSTGMVGHHSIEFMVDPTGRFTAVPRVEPPIEWTKFC